MTDLYAGNAKKLPTGIVGAPAYIAIQILAFLTNPCMTGGTDYADGGPVPYRNKAST